MIKFFKKSYIFLILISVILISNIWLITKGLPYSHDISFHYTRLIGLSNSLKTGDILALIHNSYYGYGYATGIFYSNLYFYIPAILSLMGMAYFDCYKILYILINIGTVIITYLCSKSITKNRNLSVLVTILYMFSMYRLIDVFVRAAFGEMLAFMVIPIIILGLYEIIFGNYKKWYLFTLGFVLLLHAHLISTLLVAVFSILVILLNIKSFIKEKNRIKYLFISGGVGLVLGTSFILPMLEMLHHQKIMVFVNDGYYKLIEEAVKIIDIFIPTRLFNKSLGFGLILLLPVRLFINKNKCDKNLLKFGDTLFVLGILAWISTTGIFPWDVLNEQLKIIQFPWRLLIIATSFLSFSFAIYLKLLRDDKKKIVIIYSYVVVILASLITLSIYTYSYGFNFFQYDDFDRNQIGGGEYLPSRTNYFNLNLSNPPYISNSPDIKIEMEKNGLNVKIKYSNNYYPSYTFVEVPLLKYYGYKVKGANLEAGDNDLIRLTDLDTEGEAIVYYQNTPIQIISYVISTLSFIGFVVYIVIERKKNYGFSKEIR